MFRKLMLALVASLLTLALAFPSISSATPTSDYYVWQVWGYVDQYREKNTGDVVVWFEDGNGTRITNWPNSSGTNQCPTDDGLVIAQNHPLFDRLSKTILAGGLARRKMKIAYEGVSGTCYIKMILVEM
jgi:hypothetical protein